MKTNNTFIVHPTNDEQVSVIKAFLEALKIKFELTKEENYNAEFVKKITKARQDIKDGKGTVYTTEQLNALWK